MRAFRVENGYFYPANLFLRRPLLCPGLQLKPSQFRAHEHFLHSFTSFLHFSAQNAMEYSQILCSLSPFSFSCLKIVYEFTSHLGLYQPTRSPPASLYLSSAIRMFIIQNYTLPHTCFPSSILQSALSGNTTTPLSSTHRRSPSFLQLELVSIRLLHPSRQRVHKA